MALEFMRNDVAVHNDGSRHRILLIVNEALSQDSSTLVLAHAWLIRLDDPKALPYRIIFEDLIRDYKNRPKPKIAPARETTDLHQPFMATLRAKPSAARLAVGNRAYERIEPLVNDPAILEPSFRNKLLIERCLQPGGGTPKTLLRDLRRWWQGGQTLNALTGKYDACGAGDGTGNRGRKRVRKGDLKDAAEAALRPFQMGEKDRKFMRDILEEVYLVQGSTYTLQATLRELHQRHYKYEDGNGESHLLHKLECPTYRQIEYFLKSNYPFDVRLQKRKGEKRFAQEDRSTEGSVLRDCHGAAHIYEIDATIVDVVLVSAEDPTRIVGKPTLYLIIDRYSRLIVGWYLGFENASYTAAMQALLSIGEDKEQLCERLGLPYDPNDWPAHCVVPEQFLADQGELVSRESRKVARSLRCTIANVPGLRPDWKPLVECGFKLIHQIIAPDTPGYTPDADARKRRAKNVDKEACLNIHQLEAKIVATIIFQNRSLQMNYPLSLGQISDEVRPIPIELFDHSVRRRMGSLDRMDFDLVREELLPRGKAMVTGNGVIFNKVQYSCPEARSRGWLVEGRKKRRPADVAFDYRLIDEIVLYSPSGKESFIATLTKDSLKFQGMSFKEVHQHFADAEDLKAGGTEINRQNRYQLHKLTQPMVAAAKKEMEAATKGVSRSSRRKDTAPARALELRKERTGSAGVRRDRGSPNVHLSTYEDFDELRGHTLNVVPINREVLVEQFGGDAPLAGNTPDEQAAPRAKTLTERMAEFRKRL